MQQAENLKNQETKLLSLVIIGRNDNYMGNFKYRLTTAINFLAKQIEALNHLDNIEILITDWNSDTALSGVLDLTATAAQLCKFIRVPPEVAAIVQPVGVKFHGAKATNVAIRRAAGEYIMLFDADSLMPRHSLHAILDLLAHKLTLPYDVSRTYFFCGRYQIPWEIVQRQPNLEMWERFLVLNSGQLPLDGRPFGLGIFGIGLMMHKKLWHECRGYHETMPGWGWVDAELALRVTQCYPWIDLASIGVTIFHMEHNQRRNKSSSGGGHKLNPYDVSMDFAINGDQWGIADRTFAVEVAKSFQQKEVGKENQQIPFPQWTKSRADLLTELINNEVCGHVKRYLSSRRVADYEWGSLYALAWYALYRYPRTYLEFGLRNPFATQIVASACSGVEIYGVDSWQQDGQPAPPPAFVTTALESVGYRGYLRFITGDTQSSLERLKDSFVGEMEFDLILLRGDLFGDNVESILQQALHALAPEGLLIFNVASSNIFIRQWSEIQQHFPSYTYIQCPIRHTGLIIAATLQPGSIPVNIVEEEQQLAERWRKIIFSPAQFAIWGRRIDSLWQQMKTQSPQQWPQIIGNRWHEFRKHWQTVRS